MEYEILLSIVKEWSAADANLLIFRKQTSYDEVRDILFSLSGEQKL